MSTIVGNIIVKVTAEHPDLDPAQIARSLALLSGAILLFFGLVRWGFIVEFIPLVAIASFMTGSAISIGVGQVATMMGIKDVNNRDSTYLVIINTLKGLPTTSLDAAMGLSALFGLYFIRWFCSYMGNRYPSRKKTWFFISTLRMAFIIILYILVSWLVNRGITDPKKAKFKILGPVPSGKFASSDPSHVQYLPLDLAKHALTIYSLEQDSNTPVPLTLPPRCFPPLPQISP